MKNNLLKTLYIILFSQVFFLPLLFSYYTYESFEATKYIVFFLYNIVFFLLFLYLHKEIKLSPIHLIIFFVLFYGLLTILWSSNKISASRRLLFWSNYFLWSIIVYNMPVPKKKIDFLIYSTTFIVILLGIGQAVGLDYSTVFEGGRVFSTLSNPNFLSNYLMLISIYALVNFFNSRDIYGLIIGLLCVFTIFLAQTRGAFLGLIIAVTLYFLKKKFRLTRKEVVYIVIFVMLLSLGGVRLKARFVQGLREGNTLYRLFIWNNALRISAEHPLGIGIDNFFMHYPFYQADFRRLKYFHKNFGILERAVHNEYLQMLAETGVPGAALIVLTLVLFAKNIRLNSARDLALLGFLVHSFFSFPFHLSTSLLYFAFFASVTYTAKSRGKPVQISTRYAGTVFVIIAFLNLLFAPRYFLWQTWYKTADYYNKIRDYRKAEIAFTRCTKFGKRIGYINHDFGVALSYLKKWQKAKKHFLYAWKYNPSDTSKINLGNCYYMTKKYFLAYKSYKEGLEINPEKESGWYNLNIVKKYMKNALK